MSLMTSNPSAPQTSLKEDAQFIGLVGLAHGISHYSQLLLPPLFPWLKEAFGVSYTQLGLLLTIFFVVSCAVQAVSGFLVDRHGPRPVLLSGLSLLVVAAVGFATAPSYEALALWVIVAGLGNGVFHPVDFSLLNRKVRASRLGHAYSVHGISGNLGWALAPALLVPVALLHGWRVALLVAAVPIAVVLLLLWWQRARLQLAPVHAAVAVVDGGGEGAFAFLRLPTVWMCFAFFLFSAAVLSVVQTYAPEAARQLHGVPVQFAAACVSVYMVCSAIGMVGGGFLAADPSRCERIVAAGFGLAMGLSLLAALAPLPGMAVPVLFGAMGLVTGSSGPSRDLLVKRATPVGATGRVYGVVYAGLDIGQALAPLVFGRLMDLHRYQDVLLGLALLQLLLIANAFNVGRSKREVLAPA
ncbi:MAG: MFS transporter [Burkholderiales bacterium]